MLAYQTLGVVFGGLVTSPLYVWPTIQLSNPGETEFLGVLSLIFWTFTLVALVKYGFIVINADDHGEGSISQPISLFEICHSVFYFIWTLLVFPFMLVDASFLQWSSSGIIRNPAWPLSWSIRLACTTGWSQVRLLRKFSLTIVSKKPIN